MSDLAGRLHIQLQRTAQGLSCRIDSTRPVTAAAVFVGRTPLATATLLPRLFSVCAKAQAAASAMALERACGLNPAPPTATTRALSVAAETVREHLWRILLDWPRLLGTSPERATMAKVLSQVKDWFGLCDPDGHLFWPGTAAVPLERGAGIRLLAGLDALLTQQVFGMHPEQWLQSVSDAPGFDRWCEIADSTAARLMRELIASGEAGLGHTPLVALPALADDVLIARMGAPDGTHLLARPTWDGVARETSPFARCADRGLIRALSERYGCGILVRLTAQLLEVALRLSEIRSVLAGNELIRRELAENALPVGVGLGRAAAARGLLVHLTQVTQNRVTDYRILAPTEWNFHPQGSVARSLATLPDAEDCVLIRQAELLVMATDPCVAFDLTIR